jgi:hypothetical protein
MIAYVWFPQDAELESKSKEVHPKGPGSFTQAGIV